VATPSHAPPAVSSAAQATPAPAAAGTPSPSGAVTPRTASYAGAVKTAPTDFHLAFFLDGKSVNLQDTVYGIVHKHHQTLPAGSPFGQSVNLTWKKVDGPAPGRFASLSHSIELTRRTSRKRN
jgi:E3 ubiquitin-protein ligase TRIP12